VFFLDDRSFPEPAAFWVGGERTSTLVLQPDSPRAAVSILVRNGPVANHAILRDGTWSVDVPLAAGEEREVSVPFEPGRRARMLTITSTAGFRPSEADPKSRDTRFLGIWVKVVG
jgi:hypothetical protein